MVPDFQRNIVISFISIVFLLYPRLVQSAFSMFECVSIDSGDNRSKINLYDSCYGSNHIKWLLAIAFPILVVWVISMPAIALYLLYKNHSQNEDNKVKQYFLILYQGLKPKAYYWEFVNTFRKVWVIMFFNIMYFVSQPIKIILSLILLVALMRLQNWIKPYKEERNNMIEMRAMIAWIWTMISALIFTQDNQVSFMSIWTYIFVLFINAWFVFEWIYMLLLCTQSKYKFIQLVSNLIYFWNMFWSMF